MENNLLSQISVSIVRNINTQWIWNKMLDFEARGKI